MLVHGHWLPWVCPLLATHPATPDSTQHEKGQTVNTSRPRQNEQHFTDDIFKRTFFNENVWISIKISLKFVPKGPINNIPSLVQIMAWRHSVMHICFSKLCHYWCRYLLVTCSVMSNYLNQCFLLVRSLGTNVSEIWIKIINCRPVIYYDTPLSWLHRFKCPVWPWLLTYWPGNGTDTSSWGCILATYEYDPWKGNVKAK